MARLVTPKQVRNMLGIGEMQFKVLMATEVLKPVERTSGGHRRFDLSDVETLKVQLENTPAEQPDDGRKRPEVPVADKRLPIVRRRGASTKTVYKRLAKRMQG